MICNIQLNISMNFFVGGSVFSCKQKPPSYLLERVEATGFAQTHQIFKDCLLQFLLGKLVQLNF